MLDSTFSLMARPASSFGRSFFARNRYLLQQGIKGFSLEEAVVIHRMANGCYLPCVDPITERVWRNAQILSSLGDSEVIR